MCVPAFSPALLPSLPPPLSLRDTGRCIRGMACPDVCVAEYQCPNGLLWDPVGQCVESSDCSVQWVGPLPPSAGPMEPAEPACALGDECGGQVWNDCGTSCPLICGQLVGMCNM